MFLKTVYHGAGQIARYRRGEEIRKNLKEKEQDVYCFYCVMCYNYCVHIVLYLRFKSECVQMDPS